MYKSKIITIVFFMSTFLLACQAQQKDTGLLKAEAFEKMLKENPEIQLVDVRTSQEYATGNIQNAVNVDISGSDFQSTISKMDKSKPIAVYCAAGGRSGRAAAQLKQMGFQSVYDLEGGMGAWQKAKLPVVK